MPSHEEERLNEKERIVSCCGNLCRSRPRRRARLSRYVVWRITRVLIHSVLGVTHSRQAAIRVGSRSVTISKSTTASITETIARRTSTPKSAAPPLINPPAECTWKTELTVSSSYQDGVLVSTTSTWRNPVNCLDGNNNTSMAYLRAYSELYRDTDLVKKGDVQSCVYPNTQNKLCKYVSLWALISAAGSYVLVSTKL